MARIACANKVHRTRAAELGLDPRAQHHHPTVAVVRECFSFNGGLRQGDVLSIEEQEQLLADQVETYDPDAAYERHLESAGYDEHRNQEEYEAAMGIPSWEEARNLAAADQTAKQEIADMIEAVEADPVKALGADTEPEPIRDGIYTVEAPEGQHRTFRLRTQEADAKFAPGQQVIAYLSGPNNDSDYTGFGFIKNGTLKVWKKHQSNVALVRDAEALLADPSGALKAVHCYVCHRTLNRPDSIRAGIGPDCQGR